MTKIIIILKAHTPGQHKYVGISGYNKQDIFNQAKASDKNNDAVIPGIYLI